MKILIALLNILLITACVSQKEATQEWKKAGPNGVEYAVANSVCKAESYKAIPLAETQLTGCEYKTGFAGGFCSASASKKEKEKLSIRNEIYVGCMIGQGWTPVT